jgi:hypothetical protein
MNDSPLPNIDHLNTSRRSGMIVRVTTACWLSSGSTVTVAVVEGVVARTLSRLTFENRPGLAPTMSKDVLLAQPTAWHCPPMHFVVEDLTERTNIAGRQLGIRRPDSSQHVVVHRRKHRAEQARSPTRPNAPVGSGALEAPGVPNAREVDVRKPCPEIPLPGALERRVSRAYASRQLARVLALASAMPCA